ncbi:MAG: hypothetical protein LBG45_08620 [Dysgonamonadaceae bacterium]|jgi:hypothetical protein|nr:hypothetical protein [Dysgonamonadaceae bacterium]
MKSKLNFNYLIIGIALFNFIACGHKNSKSDKSDTMIKHEQNLNDSSDADSIRLKNLIIKLLNWSETDEAPDFDVLVNSEEDSIYTGIHWEAHKKRLHQLEKTGFFTNSFLQNYQNIADFLDKELKQNPEKYYAGEIPPYSNDANIWCNCQDYPEDWEKTITIVHLNIDANTANFQWSWDNENYYSVKAEKSNCCLWKISYLEHFDIKSYEW